MLMIDVTNPLPGPLRYRNGEIRSTKTLSGHGLGLSALRRIARKHGGDIVISDSGGMFHLSVTLFM
jgi:signal transduction histidine kinase